MKNLLQIVTVLAFGFSVIFLLSGCEPDRPTIGTKIELVGVSELAGCKIYRIDEPNYQYAVVMRCPQEAIQAEQQTVTIDGVEYQRIKN